MFAASIILVLLYLVVLFSVARWGDGKSALAQKLAQHPLTYSLSLAIYCTAWTFYGATGEAADSGLAYLPILLGPMLLFMFGTKFLTKLALVSKRQRITTVADFIVSRYGKRSTTGLLVTFIALLAAIPYIALQLKAIGMAMQSFSGSDDLTDNIVLIAAVILGVFAAFFGTRKVDVSEYRSGLMLAVAFESLFKFLALMVVGIVAIFLLFDWQAPVAETAPGLFSSDDWHWSNLWSFNFIVQTLMAASAAILLPRQFHVTIVDNPHIKQIKHARWIFPLYLLFIAMVIPVIAQTGELYFAGSGISPDQYVLEIASHEGRNWLSLLVLIGGISAATAMIIVSTLTLSIMISNDVVLPLMLRHSLSDDGQLVKYRRALFSLRRLSIAGILILAYLYYQQSGSHTPLNSIGLIAFSLVLQLLPAVVGGLYWKRGHANGVFAGLGAGLLGCMLFVLMPLQEAQMRTDGVNVNFDDIISSGAFISLIANTIAYVVFSVVARERLVDRIQASAFVSPKEKLLEQQSNTGTIRATIGDIKVLLKTFLGAERTQSLLAAYRHADMTNANDNDVPNAHFVDYCERLLGGVLGSSSARALMMVVTSGKQMMLEDVVNVFDDTTQAIQFNQSLLYTSLENLEHGISVVDRDLNLVAWNRRYLELFDYPEELVQVGRPIESLVRYNAERGECGVGEIEALVQKRLDFMRSGSPHRFLRRRSDGRVIEMIGRPLPNGGFVTSFSDVTEYIESRHALNDANIDLEKRIAERSREVKEINNELHLEIARRAKAERATQEARLVAEQANASKTRFLALASHDILQPLNASRLYLSSLSSTELNLEQDQLVDKITQTVDSAESLIATLLEIARLDQGAMTPTLTTVAIKPLLDGLVQDFSVIAAQKGLVIDANIGDFAVIADTTYLRRIVQNIISNAVKYTPGGRVLVTARKLGESVRIAVYDTGPGIPPSQQKRVFGDFERLEGSESEPGVGLGLGIVQRMSKMLGTQVNLSSRLRHGSCFSVELPITENLKPKTEAGSVQRIASQGLSLNVICIDDESVNLDAMQTLLKKWGCGVDCYLGIDALVDDAPKKPDVILVDYQLNHSLDGLAVIEQLRGRWGDLLPAVLITAVQDESVKELARVAHVNYLAKPVKPAKLRALLGRLP